MKRILAIILLSMVLISSIFAANGPTSLLVIPYDGISGIPLGSNYYDSDVGGTWAAGLPSGNKYTPNTSKTDRANYTDTEMLGIIMFLNSGTTVSMKGTITITITCPNGFYLQSQSNPNYKRPFEIMIFDSWNSKGDKGTKISEAEPTKTITLSSAVTESSDTNAQIHFDVVLRLPGTVNYGTDECLKDGILFPLSELDDYSAVVTFNVKYEPDSGYGDALETTVTLPFSGFYESNQSTTAQKQAVSMSVVLNSEASSIDIKNKLGKTINIGSIYYNMMVGTDSDYKNVSSTTNNAAIFFSSSSDPYDQNATKFALVKDDIGATDALTSLNSIGFKLKVTSYEDNTSVTFDGTTYFVSPVGSGTSMSTVSGSPGERKKSEQVITSTEYIIPNLYKEYMKSYSGGAYESRTYFYYSGLIELILDDNVVTMQSGRYIETVYVHVMAYK